jgi:hypothetical protein
MGVNLEVRDVILVFGCSHREERLGSWGIRGLFPNVFPNCDIKGLFLWHMLPPPTYYQTCILEENGLIPQLDPQLRQGIIKFQTFCRFLR